MTEKHKSQRSESQNTMEIRGAYPFLHEKRTKRASGTAMPNPRYDLVLVVPKLAADPAQCSNYQFFATLAMQAAAKAWGSWPAGGHWPIQDGDAPPKPKAPTPGQAPFTPKEYPWRKGNWIVEVTHYFDLGPTVAVMQAGQTIPIPTKVVNGKTMYKSGDYCIVHVHAYTFEKEKFGVNFGFEGVLWTREGEAIGSSGPKSAQQMFGGVAPSAGQPGMGAQMGPPGVPPVTSSPPVAPVAPAALVPPMPGQVGLPPLPPGVAGR